MSEPHIFFNEVNERQGVFHRRALLAGGLTALGVLGLSGRLMELLLGALRFCVFCLRVRRIKRFGRCRV